MSDDTGFAWPDFMRRWRVRLHRWWRFWPPALPDGEHAERDAELDATAAFRSGDLPAFVEHRALAIQALRHDLRCGPADILALGNLFRAGAVAADVALEQMQAHARESLALAGELAALMDAGALPPAREPFEVAGLMEACVDGVWPDARDAAIALQGPDRWSEAQAIGDPRELAQLLRLLLHRLIASASRGTRVQLRASNSDGGCRLEIRHAPPSPVAIAQLAQDRPAGMVARRTMQRQGGQWRRSGDDSEEVWALLLPAGNAQHMAAAEQAGR
ncbi:hypothetical protein [Paracidovorax citrulli]